MKVFLSYRRKDSRKIALRIARRLQGHIDPDSVFTDVITIKPGAKFLDKIQAALNECEIVLVVIGPGWLNAPGKLRGRALDDPDDWVRMEVYEALHRDDVNVIPLLVGGAEMPDEGMLPRGLKKLGERHAITLGPGEREFEADLDALVHGLFPKSQPIVPRPDPPPVPPVKTRSWVKPASIAVGVALMAPLPFAIHGLWKPPDPTRDGLSELAAGRPAAAVESFTRALEVAPDRIDALLGRGRAYLALAKPEDDARAKRDFAEAIALGDAELSTFLALAETYVRLGEDQKASDNFGKAIEVFEKAPKVDRKSAAAAYAARAELRMKKDPKTGHVLALSDAALRQVTSDLHKAAELDPKQARYHAKIGFLLKEVDRDEEAIKELEEAVGLDPKLVDARLNLVDCYGKSKKYSKKAESAFGEWLAIDPDSHVAYEKRADFRATHGNQVGAIADYDAVLGRFKGKFSKEGTQEHYLMRAKCYEEQKMYEKSEADYTSALLFGDRDIYHNAGLESISKLRGLVRLRQGSEAEARKDLVPPNPTVFRQDTARNEYIMGQAYREIGDHARAIQCLKGAIAGDPSIGNYFRELGDVYRDMGKMAEAEENFALSREAEQAKEKKNEELRRKFGGQLP